MRRAQHGTAVEEGWKWRATAVVLAGALAGLVMTGQHRHQGQPMAEHSEPHRPRWIVGITATDLLPKSLTFDPIFHQNMLDGAATSARARTLIRHWSDGTIEYRVFWDSANPFGQGLGEISWPHLLDPSGGEVNEGWRTIEDYIPDLP